MKTIKQELSDLVLAHAKELAVSKGLGGLDFERVFIEETPEEHGDLTTNVALKVAKGFKIPPPKLANELLASLARDARFNALIAKSQVAGPGFLNFTLSGNAYHRMLMEILTLKEKFGRSRFGGGKKVLIEFVSANPTGPLTVAHGRQAAVGDVLANILAWAGYDVKKEYLINDRGRQIQILGRSTFLRYKELLGQAIEMPEDGYQGAYVSGVAQRAREKIGEKYAHSKEEEALAFFSQFACEDILADIRADLDRFGVRFDIWFSEKKFSVTGRVQEVLDFLRKKGNVYEKDGAVWFASTNFGDDKDRVLVKSSGEMTYIAPDIAYHDDKMRRGFQEVINIWGPDHHGYIPRLRAALVALGYSKEALRVIILQLATLYRDGKQLSMSTRAGEFVTLRQVMDEVGTDAGRYFFVRRKTDSHLDFDLELAKKQTPENPVFYVQYAHARISSIFRKAQESGLEIDARSISEASLACLTSAEELKLIKLLSRWEEILEDSARNLEPHWVALYLESCAGQFHRFYTECRVLGESVETSKARLTLCHATQIILKNGLDVLGVHAPTKM